MSKRPMCQAAVLLVVLQVILYNLLPELFGQQDIPAGDGESVTISGQIYDRQEKKDKICYYLKEIIFIQSDETSRQFQGRCMVYCSDDRTYSIGNYVQLKGTLSYFEEAANPGQFDAKSYYRGMGIDFAVFQAGMEVTDNQKDMLKEGLYAFRNQIHKRIEELAGKHSSILHAMLLGEKSQMDSEIKELYQKNGISHILVISGLHFSLLGMTLYKLLRKAGTSYGIAGVLSVSVLFLYGIMTGFGVSAIRAFTMFSIAVGADITGRCYDFPTSLAAAVIGLVLSNFYVLYQSGFLLSVGAVLGMILFIPVVESVYFVPKNVSEEISGEKLLPDEAENKTFCKKVTDGWKSCILSISKTMISGMKSGAAIQMMTFPVLLYSFYEFSPYSILLNCLILPLVPVVILGAIVAVVVSFFLPWLGSVIILPSLRVLDLYEFLCRCVEKLPASTIITGKPPMYRIIIYYVVILLAASGIWALRERDKDRKKIFLWRNRRVFAAAVTGTVLVITGWLVFSREKEGMEIAMLDVGQGQSVYIRCGKSDVLYDGGSTDVSEVGRYRIVPFLKSKGVNGLKLVIISHLDADHYNGIWHLFEEDAVDVECLMLPQQNEQDEAWQELVQLAESKGTKVRQVERGDWFQIEEANFEVLHPYPGYQAEDKNDASLVLSMQYDDFTMLFTGDVEKKGEEAILDAGTLLKADVLQVAHHGSASSSIQEFLDKVSPEMAWISCGENNRYGHPSEEVLERLENQSCKIYRTDRNGCVVLRIP